MRSVKAVIDKVIKPLDKDLTTKLIVAWPIIAGKKYVDIYIPGKVFLNGDILTIYLACEKSQAFLIPYIERQLSQKIKKIIGFTGSVVLKFGKESKLRKHSDIKPIPKEPVPESLTEALDKFSKTFHRVSENK